MTGNSVPPYSVIAGPQSVLSVSIQSHREADKFDHRGFVVLAHMGIDFQQKGAIVFVPQPLCDRPDIDSRCKTGGSEEMS